MRAVPLGVFECVLGHSFFLGLALGESGFLHLYEMFFVCVVTYVVGMVEVAFVILGYKYSVHSIISLWVPKGTLFDTFRLKFGNLGFEFALLPEQLFERVVHSCSRFGFDVLNSLAFVVGKVIEPCGG